VRSTPDDIELDRPTQRVLKAITALARADNRTLLEDAPGIDMTALRSALQQLIGQRCSS
jgi:hypothetical protein